MRDNYDEILIVNNNTDKIAINQKYVQHLISQKQQLNDILDSLLKQKYKYVNEIELNVLLEDKKTCLYFISSNKQKYVMSKNMLNKHNEIVTNNKKNIYGLLDRFDDCIISKSYDNCSNIVSDLKLSLEYVLDDTKYNIKYNECLKFVSEYEEIKLRLKNINRNIHNYYLVIKIDKKISTIKNYIQSIDDTNFQLNNIDKMITYCYNIENNVSYLADEYSNQLDIFKNYHFFIS